MSDTPPVDILNRRILLVDDMESIHDDIKKILLPTSNRDELDKVTSLVLGEEQVERQGEIDWQIDSAFQGADGLARVEDAVRKRRPYSLAFVDMRMPPGWDGVETIERIWRVDPNLQIVICTAHSDYSWEETIERLGLTDQLLILKKPFEPVEIRQVACSLANKWHLAQQLQTHIDTLEHSVTERTEELRSTNLQLERSNAELKNQIARRTAAEAMLEYKAMHDALTGLPNRPSLMDRVDRCLTRLADSPGEPCALLFLDIDNFKTINDSLGHEVGDDLLIQISQRLRSCAREMGPEIKAEAITVARLGGDEFVVLIEKIGTDDGADAFASRLQEVICEPIRLNGMETTVSSSIGITRFQNGERTVDDLIREADTAMYRAKNTGKARHAQYDEEMHLEFNRRLTLENELREATANSDFTLQYQPIISLVTGSVCGFEALVRWVSPNRGMVSPASWIPMAEELGLIVDIGQWVLDESCRQLREWEMICASAVEALNMNINVSRRQIIHGDLAERIDQALRTHNVRPEMLTVEITETAIMENIDSLTPVMEQLRSTGISLSMDDFGTGYSSLACLHGFPLHAVKIDRAFLANSDENRGYAAVNQAIISLAHNLGIEVVAEGVESAGQLAQLQAMECDKAQGFLFARPLDPADALHLIQNPEVWSRKSA